jgi:hypothetical protein
MSQPNEQELAAWKAYLQQLQHYVPKLEAYLETGETDEEDDSETPKPPRPPLPPNG